MKNKQHEIPACAGMTLLLLQFVRTIISVSMSSCLGRQASHVYVLKIGRGSPINAAHCRG